MKFVKEKLRVLAGYLNGVPADRPELSLCAWWCLSSFFSIVAALVGVFDVCIWYGEGRAAHLWLGIAGELGLLAFAWFFYRRLKWAFIVGIVLAAGGALGGVWDALRMLGGVDNILYSLLTLGVLACDGVFCLFTILDWPRNLQRTESYDWVAFAGWLIAFIVILGIGFCLGPDEDQAIDYASQAVIAGSVDAQEDLAGLLVERGTDSEASARRKVARFANRNGWLGVGMKRSKGLFSNNIGKDPGRKRRQRAGVLLVILVGIGAAGAWLLKRKSQDGPETPSDKLVACGDGEVQKTDADAEPEIPVPVLDESLGKKLEDGMETGCLAVLLTCCFSDGKWKEDWWWFLLIWGSSIGVGIAAHKYMTARLTSWWTKLCGFAPGGWRSSPGLLVAVSALLLLIGMRIWDGASLVSLACAVAAAVLIVGLKGCGNSYAENAEKPLSVKSANLLMWLAGFLVVLSLVDSVWIGTLCEYGLQAGENITEFFDELGGESDSQKALRTIQEGFRDLINAL